MGSLEGPAPALPPVGSGALVSASSPWAASLTPTELRHKVLENGYTPLPNIDKRCFLSGWPRVRVSHAVIKTWAKYTTWDATGLRLDDRLAVIDLDVDHPVIEKILTRLRAEFPEQKDAMVRHGKGHKVAIFLRTSSRFNRICTGSYTAPGGQKDNHAVEVFGGGARRQFGSHGAHSKDDRGKVLRSYAWLNDRSPLTVRLEELPVLSPIDFQRIADLADEILKAEGFRLAGRPQMNLEADRVYDLMPDMRFELDDGSIATLEELKQLAGLSGLRCSASWLIPGAKNRRRCLIGKTHSGHLTIFETAAFISHMEASLCPRSRLDNASKKLAALLQARKLGGGRNG